MMMIIENSSYVWKEWLLGSIPLHPPGAKVVYTYTRLGIYVSDDKVIFILRGIHFLCESVSL